MVSPLLSNLSLHEVLDTWCRTHRHATPYAQWQHLRAAMRGHYGSYGITGNARRLDRYCEAVKRLWRKWLGRRSNRRDLSWARFLRILQRYPLLPPRVVHSVYRAVHAVS